MTTMIPDANDLVRAVTCPACGHHVAVPFFEGGLAPLATLAWPASAEEAHGLARLPLDFVRCVDCGHVFNAAFDYAAVPYTDRPNRMFNRAPGWSAHLLMVRDEMLARLPSAPVVVEIGHGDGHLLTALAEARPEGRYVGFDPHGAAEARHGSVELRPALFVPAADLPELRPDLIVSRHVMEHLTDPLGFIQQLAFAAAWADVEPALYLEVPCIDRALETGRTFDFYYEHNSHFTTTSFTRMLSRCGVTGPRIRHGYGDEVIYAFVRLAPGRAQILNARAAVAFRDAARRSAACLRAQMDDLAASGRSVAIWGGTGKAAAFIVQAGADDVRFPVVVDSDADKVGTFVPGAGQEIRFRDWLRVHPVDVIIVPAHWRARDIVREMAACGITCRTVLIEFGGRLVDYFGAPHPYRDTTRPPAPTREAFVTSA
jgi:SAM-dependent methyltransferase